jgi:hypothetical protein
VQVLESRDPAVGEGAAGHASFGEDWVTLALGTCLTAGLFLDGYAHTYVIDTETEDFFTPWHGVFYASFAVLAAWVALVGYRRRQPGPFLDWFPASYRPALAGLLVFAAGGAGDAIWHTAYGVEVGIDALLSPTHLLLFAGGLLILWTPVRSSAARGDGSAALAVGTVALVTAGLVFFVQYLWYVPQLHFARQPFEAGTGEGVWAVQQFFGGAVATTVVLVGPLLLIARRWALPFGAALTVWGGAAGLEALAFSRELRPVLLVALGGLAFDAAHRAVPPGPWRLRAAASAGPAALFAGYLVAASRDGDLGWPPEIWGGLVLLAGFVGLGLALVQESGGSTYQSP